MPDNDELYEDLENELFDLLEKFRRRVLAMKSYLLSVMRRRGR